MKKLSFFLAFLLAACGGGGSSSPPATAPAASVRAPVAPSSYHPLMSAALVATPAPQRVIRIGLYGDSTVLGWSLFNGVYQQVPGNEPASLQTMFDNDFGPGRVIVNNHGVGGTTCTELLAGGFPFTQSWAAEMAQSTDDLITVNEAINDWESDTVFTDCYVALGITAQGHSKGFIVEGPNPIGYPAAQGQRMAGALVADETSAAGQLNVPYIPMLATIAAYYPNWLADEPDQIHPDAALYWYKALIAYQTLKPVVATMLNQ